MRVLLVNSPHSEDGEKVRRFSRPWPPLDLLNCAALLRRDGHDVSLLDYCADVVSVAALDEAATAADRIFITTTPLDRWQCPTLDTDATFAFIRGFPADPSLQEYIRISVGSQSDIATLGAVLDEWEKTV
jgi:anaerobic magnesium-protoporphyrin IX monomethyl ester cyclase